MFFPDLCGDVRLMEYMQQRGAVHQVVAEKQWQQQLWQQQQQQWQQMMMMMGQGPVPMGGDGNPAPPSEKFLNELDNMQIPEERPAATERPHAEPTQGGGGEGDCGR
ncbi:uncharacterized protein Tco025E_05877 [Trypanosoma conorhini]|uniref:Uncharacterized protein n=1 Tax=Trypanosoma conorhini TaxID=83891 RepID=A0A3R7N8J1_9TRYP|nr:uncharacterized protein Tco025E_05877 [Trypanosoma conorhini]RNF14620.1 hypothetical protein Tco025E_05877 [Trypanosoma conorhini]